MSHPCPCCGHLTLTNPEAFEICPVCLWEDDPAQAAFPDLEGGANEANLNDARATYRVCGASSRRLASRARRPRPEEIAPETTEP